MGRLAASFAATIAAGALLVGCGGSSDSNSTSATTPAPAATTSSTGGTTSTPSAAAAATAEACYKALRAQTTLPDPTKKKLEKVCAKAASGDTQAFRKALQEACEEVISNASIPEGVDKQAALQACKRK